MGLRSMYTVVRHGLASAAGVMVLVLLASNMIRDFYVRWARTAFTRRIPHLICSGDFVSRSQLFVHSLGLLLHSYATGSRRRW